MSYTIKDVASWRMFYYQRCTRYQLGKPGVRPETKARILTAVKQFKLYAERQRP